MPPPSPKPADFAAARFHMIESQIRPNKVRDERVLTAMETVPRELFVPPSLAGMAYIDEDVQVAPGRFLLEPMILARLLQEAGIGGEERVLDIAVATGYSTAVIASFAQEVVGVESDPALQRRAIENMRALNIKNAEVQPGLLTEGWKAKAPYDVILINGGIDVLPDSLTQQLEEGGRLLAVCRAYGPARAAHTGEARLYKKIRGALSFRALFDANVPPLSAFAAAGKFTF
jgi:protein-L-isoaspartate(D-aspartate) O-methyltransferase